MSKPLLFLLSSTFLLTACDPVEQQTITAEEMMKMIEGPEISTMDKTMLDIARQAEAKGEYQKASSTYKQLIDKNPDDVPIALAYANALRKSGEGRKAIQIFDNILRKEPQNLDALEGKGLTQLSLADTDAAGKTLTRVMQSAPNRWQTLNGIGIIFTTKSMLQEAQQYFDAALVQKPGYAAILNNKGLVYALSGDYNLALQALFAAGEVAETDKHKTQADMNAALVYAIAGDINKAENMAARHLEGPILQNNLGLYALLSKDEQLARTHLHMALSESKVFYEKAWNNLSMLDTPSQRNRNSSSNTLPTPPEAEIR